MLSTCQAIGNVGSQLPSQANVKIRGRRRAAGAHRAHVGRRGSLAGAKAGRTADRTGQGQGREKREGAGSRSNCKMSRAKKNRSKGGERVRERGRSQAGEDAGKGLVEGRFGGLQEGKASRSVGHWEDSRRGAVA